jgi:hypothetical protein
MRTSSPRGGAVAHALAGRTSTASTATKANIERMRQRYCRSIVDTTPSRIR